MGIDRETESGHPGWLTLRCLSFMDKVHHRKKPRRMSFICRGILSASYQSTPQENWRAVGLVAVQKSTRQADGIAGLISVRTEIGRESTAHRIGRALHGILKQRQQHPAARVDIQFVEELL